MPGPMLRNEIHANNLLRYAGKKIILFTKISEINIPGGHASFRWKRPSAIWLQDENGQEQLIKIADPTRQIVLTLFGVAIAATSLVWLRQLATLKTNITN